MTSLETPKGVNSLKYGFCYKCSGRAFDFGLLSQQSHALFIVKLVKLAREENLTSRFRCPKCRKLMKNVLVHHACSDCQVFWIEDFEADPRLKAPWTEMEKDRKTRNEPEPLMERIVQNIVESGIESGRKKWAALEFLVPSLNETPSKSFPSVSYSLIGLIFFIPLLPIQKNNIDLILPTSRVEEFNSNGINYSRATTYVYHEAETASFQKAVIFGYLPNSTKPQYFRIISAFFLHFSLFPLLLAAGLIQLFGLPVEKFLGSARFLAVVASSAFFGYLAAGVMDAAGSEHYLIGSMSGVAGIVGFYSLAWFQVERLRNMRMRPVISLFFAMALIWQVSLIIATLGDYAISYATQPWVGFAVGALWALFFAEHPANDRKRKHDKN